MAKHQVGVTTYDGELLGWVLDLPGCIAAGRDLAGVEEKLPLVIAEYEGWLRSHGEAVGEASGWEIVQTVDATAFAATGGEFCLEEEYAPLGREELERHVRYLQHARSDLLRKIEHLPDAVLDWRPPNTAAEHIDPWAPDVRTIRGIVQHTLQLEVYYRESLHDGPAPGIFERVDDPQTELERTLDRIRSLTDGDLSRVFRPIHPGRTVAEDWTLRKVLRRYISHERVHTAEIAQRHTWILLGVPRTNEGTGL
ncbi:MAG: DinB family protein [Dehalococcoidia bacterium]